MHDQSKNLTNALLSCFDKNMKIEDASDLTTITSGTAALLFSYHHYELLDLQNPSCPSNYVVAHTTLDILVLNVKLVLQ